QQASRLAGDRPARLLDQARQAQMQGQARSQAGWPWRLSPAVVAGQEARERDVRVSRARAEVQDQGRASLALPSRALRLLFDLSVELDGIRDFHAVALELASVLVVGVVHHISHRIPNSVYSVGSFTFVLDLDHETDDEAANVFLRGPVFLGSFLHWFSSGRSPLSGASAQAFEQYTPGHRGWSAASQRWHVRPSTAFVRHITHSSFTKSARASTTEAENLASFSLASSL